jgi:hypothetical protein
MLQATSTGKIASMRRWRSIDRFRDAAVPRLLRSGMPSVVFAALTLCASVGLAEDDPPKAATTEFLEEEDPADDSDLGSQLANPSAPVMSIISFLDIKQHNGTAPGAQRASFGYTIQPAFPFPTKLGNVILRPKISAQFGQPYVDGAGNVATTTQFDDITLDSLWGTTLDNGLMIMGGFSTVFQTGSNTQLRADWGIGPEMVIGYASPKNGNVYGTILNYTWSLPTRPMAQTLAGQYFYAINLKDQWQIAAAPTWSYSLETKTVRFPVAVGLRRVVILGKKRQPVQFGAELWAYTPPPGGSRGGPVGPEWTIRIRIAPVIPLPWKYVKNKQ